MQAIMLTVVGEDEAFRLMIEERIIAMHPTEEGVSDAAQMEMPRYVSHKKVWALEIETVSIGAPYRMKPKDAGYAEVTLPAEMWSRYQPVSGDYYVVYADGYKSFSPRKAFLEGYTREE